MRLLFAILLTVLTATAALAERRVALVMGADEYRSIRPLQNAVNDAQALEEALRKIGFEVFFEQNRDLRRMRRALDDFSEDAAGADVALVFFAGHGVEIAGRNRLLPVDADASSLEALEKTTLPLEEVSAVVGAAGKVGLILLDACRNDPFDGEGGEGRSAAPLNPQVKAEAKPGLGRMGRAENMLFAFSAAPGQTAEDGAAGNSPFTAALAKYLGAEGLEIRSVLTLVQQEVYDQSRGRQLPYVESGLPRLFFAAQATGAVPERERLLLAMADITPDIRTEVETIATDADMPLAPLYAALISSDGRAMADGDRRQKLREAASSFVKVRSDLRTLSSSDPRVAALRAEAEGQLALGAFGEARSRLDAAAAIDAASRQEIKANFTERTLSEAATHFLSGGAALAELNYRPAIADYEKAVALYAEAAPFGLTDEARYRQALSLELIGTTWMTLGDLAAAGRAYEAMAQATEKRASAASADNMGPWRDLAVARNKVAEVKLAQGDLAGALAAFEQSREGLRAVIDKEPRLEYLRDLAVSYNRTGDVRRISGDGPAAVQDYSIGLKVTEFLVEQLPGDDGFRRDLGVSHSKLGLALRLTNDLAGSLSHYRQSLAISEELAAKAPADSEIQRDLTVNLNAVGDLARLTGDEAGAFDPYQRSVGISRALAARDPQNTLWQRDLSVGLGKLADARRAAGDATGALADYREALDLSLRLVALDRANAEWQRDVSVGRNKVGDMLLGAGDKASAAKEYGAASAIAEAQLAADPQNVQRTVDAAYSRYKLATAGVDPKANLDMALAALRRLKSESRLPAANESWIGMVETAIVQLAKP